MMSIKLEPLSENKNAHIDTERKVITVSVAFEKRMRIGRDTNFRYCFCEIEYTGDYTEQEVANIEALTKKGKAIIEGLLLDRNVRFKLSNSL